MSRQKEFGDFQTPTALAARVACLVDSLYGCPDLVIEPTAGLGAFLEAASAQWRNKPHLIGYEINAQYVDQARERIKSTGAIIHHRDFFSEDWRANLSNPGTPRVLILGNPPWVTNSDLGQLGSSNLPQKSNFQGMRGLDALTGKANFDIAEWMLIRLLDALPPNGALAMLCKTATARKVLRHYWKSGSGPADARLFHIDAKSEFDVAVDACLFYATSATSTTRIAEVYPSLDLSTKPKRFGFVAGDLVSDLDSFEAHKHLDGGCSTYIWRSGIKHDAAKVMEFTRLDGRLVNGYGETADIEDHFIYPLLKSSDLANERLESRKAVLVPQAHTGEDTNGIRIQAPKTWRYLTQHAAILDSRKSSIYRGRPRFSIFGVGAYSFSPWKIAVSGLYKCLSFQIIPPMQGRPVMVDDTCYSIPCQDIEEASIVASLLRSRPAIRFLESLIFPDSKRPVTVDVLRRLSIVALARHLGRFEDLAPFLQTYTENADAPGQMMLAMDQPASYRALAR